MAAVATQPGFAEGVQPVLVTTMNNLQQPMPWPPGCLGSLALEASKATFQCFFLFAYLAYVTLLGHVAGLHLEL